MRLQAGKKMQGKLIWNFEEEEQRLTFANFPLNV
jgi:hypothetical protein